MLTSNEDPTIAENTGILYVIPRAASSAPLPTPALKNQVLRQVTEVYPCTLTFQVSVQDPVCRVIDLAARLFLRQGYSANDVRDRVRANLAAYFRISDASGQSTWMVGRGAVSTRTARGTTSSFPTGRSFGCRRDRTSPRR
jgi:hypothetical protein